ncbi:MAG: hypothetical protein IJY17_01400 [Alphaproteobacteria bacterium]|nr:hypothetical protein [Alphaproteobacteria bacterium]
MTASHQQSEELKVLRQLFAFLSETDKRSFLSSLDDSANIPSTHNTPDFSCEVTKRKAIPLL